MLQLQEGVKIIASKQEELSLWERVTLSDGVEVSKSLVPDIPYCDHAIIPKKPWREPNRQEKEILFSNIFPSASGDWVCIVKIPFQIAKKLSPLTKVQNPEQFDELLQTPYGVNVINILRHFASTLSHGEMPSKYGIGWNLPNQSTVTITKNCYEGLHVDQGDNLPIETRNNSKNRLLLNIGVEPRYFLFVNLNMQHILNMIMTYDTDISQHILGMSRLGLIFMKKYPEYPVVRLRIEPGEGYIAPTDNIIHDGSTEGTKALDMIFTVRSNFRLP